MSDSLSTARLAPPRVAPNPWHAFGGIWRLTFRSFLVPGSIVGGVIALALFTLLGFAVVRPGRDVSFTDWTAGFYLSVVLPLAAFLSGAGAMRDELKSSSIDYVLTRPVRRAALVAFKFLSHLACIELLYAVAIPVLLAIARARGITLADGLLPRLCLAQFLTTLAFAAFGFFCAAITSRYIILGLFYGGVVEIGIGSIPTQLSRLSLIQQFRSILQPVMKQLPLPPDGAASIPGVILFALGFAVLAIGITALLFSVQEFAGAKARDI